MPPHRTAAVVLAVRDHGESDKIVTFLCPHQGKFTCIAKGAKRSKRRFVNKLEMFSLLEIIYDDRFRGTLAQVSEAELIDSFITLRTEFDRYVSATLIIELTLLWTRENDGDEEIFPLLVWFLDHLNQGMNPVWAAILFQGKLFSIMGYRPHLTGCLECGRNDGRGNPYRFSPPRGGILCCGCGSSASPVPVSLGTVRLLETAIEMPLNRISRLRFSPSSLREALAVFRQYGQYLLQREVHSWGALTSLAE